MLHEAYNGAGQDPKGNDVESWAPAVELGIYAYNPSASSEILIDGHAHRVESSPTLYVPSSAVVGNRDRITARGKPFLIDGDPADYRNPIDSSMDGISIKLKAVTG